MKQNDPRLKKIQQVGLTSNSEAQVTDIANKVDSFNRSKDGIFVELEIMESPPEEIQQTGRFRLLFTFANREAQRAFWMGNW